MNRILLWVRYDGTRFHGWQLQKDSRTVQGELTAALARLLGTDFHLATSSRTDAGVHARRHPVVVETSATIPAEGLAKGLNALLDRDVAIVDFHPVGPGFDSRRSSHGKSYRYLLDEGRMPDPFLDPYAWRIRRHLDLHAMRAAARSLVGEHDFDAFRSAHCDSPNTRRLVHAIHVERTGRVVAITVCGNAFLRNMVRIIAGTLVDVGLHRHPPQWTADLLAGRDRTRSGMTAPARGLHLLDVHYPADVLCDGAFNW